MGDSLVKRQPEPGQDEEEETILDFYRLTTKMTLQKKLLKTTNDNKQDRTSPLSPSSLPLRSPHNKNA